ncbi:MAG TPA: 50S ribosomal protein L23 [Bacteroidetes bacterium]|nr:50S ribosomal protein L23 [Bacteroidota bacterium]
MNILVKPVITEKAETLAEEQNKYTFVVDRKANKLEIKNAVEEMYNVNVTDVNTSIVPGKVKVRGTRSGYQKGRKPAYKKAVISVEEGEVIDIYGNV